LKSKEVVSCMEVILSVFFEIFSILIMGIICFALYINGKILLIKIGLIADQRDDISNLEDEQKLTK